MAPLTRKYGDRVTVWLTLWFRMPSLILTLRHKEQPRIEQQHFAVMLR